MMATRDFNEDGIIDIVTNDSNVRVEQYSILLGNSVGSFKTQVTAAILAQANLQPNRALELIK